MEEIKSTVEHLQDLIDAREDMKTSINNKGVQVSGGLKSYADAIDRIPQNVIDGDDLNVGTGNVEYTKNGSYNINPTDYELDALSSVGVNINVPTKKVGTSRPINVTSNGIKMYNAKDYGDYDGLSTVVLNVDVPKDVNVGAGSVEYTENGSYTIKPSDYSVDALSSVGVNVNVPTKSIGTNFSSILQIKSNGAKIINAKDYGYDGLSQVHIMTNVPTKTVGAPPLPILITNNGSKTIDASDYNVDGLSQVDLQINVPQSGGDGGNYEIDFTQVGWTQEESDKMNGVESNFITNAIEYTNTIGFYSDYMNWTLMGYVDAYGNTHHTHRANPFLDDRKLVIAPMVYNLCEDYPMGVDDDFPDSPLGLFGNCVSLRYVPQMDFSHVSDLRGMFYNCSSLISVPELNVDINEKYNMIKTFYNCSSLISVPELNFEITGASSMFENCCNLPNIYKLRLKGDSLDMMDMFAGCKSLSSVDIELNESDSSKYKSYDCRHMFYGCKNLSTINFVINKERGSNVLDNISATNMFNGCENLSSITSFHSGFYLTSCAGMFENCYSLKESPTPMLRIDQDVTNSSYMFANCYSLEKLNHVDTTYVKNTSYMFKNCSSLKEIGSSNKWVIPLDKCTNASHMFDGCSSLTYIHELNTAALNSTTGMFYGCSSLVNIGPMNGLRTSIDFSSCVNLSFDSFYDIVENVFDVRFYETSEKITISSECVQRWKAEGHESQFNYCVSRLTGIGWTLSY